MTDHSRRFYERWLVRREIPSFDEFTRTRTYQFTKVRPLRLMRIRPEHADEINSGTRENEKLMEFHYLILAGSQEDVPAWSKKVS